MLGHRAQIGLDADVAGCGWMVIATSPGAVCLLSVLAVELQTKVYEHFTISELLMVESTLALSLLRHGKYT